MRLTSVALAIITAGAIASYAQAQTGPAMKEDTGSTVNTQGAPGVRAGQPANPTISAEQRTRIRAFVTETRPRPVTIRERVAIGTTLPADVELQAVPSAWGPELATFRYVYADNHVVLVEPSSRRVIQVID
jgi:Protein of unknown function (DUF1236)